MIEYDTYFEADLEYCKGCGICAEECPTKAIEMITEVGAK
jgi:Pyruvate/2-oxoacid:ferredoxin oxidoreductase delta subunit